MNIFDRGNKGSSLTSLDYILLSAIRTLGGSLFSLLLGEAEARKYLPFQERVLELLLPHHLLTLLAPSHQVWHNLLRRAERHILVDLEAFLRDVTGHLVRKADKLAESKALGALELQLVAEAHRQIARLPIVRRDKDAVRWLYSS